MFQSGNLIYAVVINPTGKIILPITTFVEDTAVVFGAPYYDFDFGSASYIMQVVHKANEEVQLDMVRIEMAD